MIRHVVDPVGRDSHLAKAVAQVLAVLLIASCASRQVDAPGIAVSPPAFPHVTPISAATEPPTPTPSEEPTSPPAEPSPQPDTPHPHTVQAGDTLLGLAKLYGVPMAAIQLENEMGESTTIQAGQTLSIPAKDEWEGCSPFWVIHTVKAGETLIGIAQEYDLEAEQVQVVNGLGDADLIAVGQALILPLGGLAVTRVPLSTVAPEPTVTEEHGEPSPPTPTASAVVSDTKGTPSDLAPEGSPTAALSSAAPPADLAAWPQEIARLINEERAKHGLDPLGYNPALEQAAQAHATDCSQRGWCSHTGSDGANIKTRVIRAGYEASGWAECWAQTQSPQRAVEVWLDETPPNDPHRRTLLTTWLTEIGIGVAEADWGKYIIADFGRPQ